VEDLLRTEYHGYDTDIVWKEYQHENNDDLYTNKWLWGNPFPKGSNAYISNSR
jgi:hypothetical protein